MSEATVETALALPVLQTALSTESIDPALAMTPEERAELGEVSVRPLIVKYDGKTGQFKNIDTEEILPTLTGAILGVSFSQTMFPPDGQEGAWPKWICRSDDVRKPPYLHPELNATQKREALAMGAGKSCESCPQRRFGDSKPPCTGAVNLAWADSSLGEIATVRASGTSITSVKHYLNWFVRKNKAVLSHQTTLAPGDKVSKGATKVWFPLSCKLGPEMSPEDVGKLRQLRQEHLANMADRVRTAAEAEISEPSADSPQAPIEGISEFVYDEPDAVVNHPAPAPAPSQPPALRGRGVSLRPVEPAQQQLDAALTEMGLGDDGDPW